ncbi:MAG: hypothetical protein WC346_13080 [Methanogenium sp.]|jgi:hypothetical protein
MSENVTTVVNEPASVESLEIKYGFDVDSKGLVKPTCQITLSRVYQSGVDLYEQARKDLEYVTELAQEALDRKPKAKY